MNKSKNRSPSLAVFLLAAAFLGIGACAEKAPSSEETPPGGEALSITVDLELAKALQNATLPAIDQSGLERPVALLRDEEGVDAHFMENELLVSTENTAALDELLARWNGTLLGTLDAQAGGLDGVPNSYLVRVEASAATTDALIDELKKISPQPGGRFRVSSEAGLKLFAIATKESQTAELSVGINWVATGSDIASSHTEDEAGDGYSSNAFDWGYMNAGGTQDIGVTEAWRLLNAHGKLDRWIKLAILDMGFDPAFNQDIDSSLVAISNVPAKSPLGSDNISSCTGGNPCPWHGTNVSNAAMGLLDNLNGAAGPAGPVAKPVLIFTLYDFFTGMSAIMAARIAGAKIINMSYSCPVPAILSWSVIPFEIVTRAVSRHDVLLFAAAGNSGQDVDKKRCILGICWERTWHTPCENDGVICVGGLAENSTARDPASNFGRHDVDIFAPFTVLVGADRSSMRPPGASHKINGTSFSSPFAAGVAALTWSADRSLSADQVWDIMKRTAHISSDDSVALYVNAQAAVEAALGADLHISSPLDGSSFVRGRPVDFSVEASSGDHSDPSFSWNSNLQGDFGTGPSLSLSTLEVGSHAITVTAVFSDGFTLSDHVIISITNLPPELSIDQPVAGSHFPLSGSIQANGSSFDGDLGPDFRLSDAQVSWSLDGHALGSGHVLPPFTPASIGLAVGGPYPLIFQGSDGYDTASSTVNLFVDADPVDLPPVLTILSPVHNSSAIADQQDPSGAWYKSFTLSYSARDPEDGVLPFSALRWSYSLNGAGEQPLPITSTLVPIPGSTKTTTRYSIQLYGSASSANIYEIILRAVDSFGNVGTHRVKVTVNPFI